MKTILLALAIIYCTISFGQVYNMSNSTISTCGGKFYDSGGVSSDYSLDENFTMTICSSDPNKEISVHFLSFEIENNYDYLTIYNGNSVNINQLVGNFTGTDLSGLTIQSNETGCLTFVFTSDGSVENSGWDADIECKYECQNFSFDILVSNGTVNNSTILLCNNNPFYIYVSGIYNNNDIGYHQSDSTSLFEFEYNSNIYSGNTLYIDSVSSNFSIATLTITDTMGCSVNQQYTILVIPSVNIFINSSNDTINLNDSIFLNAQFYSDTLIYPLINTFLHDGLFFIPDGSGVSYESNIYVNSSYNGNILDTNMLKAVCLNMEHSYSGDTDIELKCPNGQSIILKENTGSSTFLGEPIDDDSNTNPGIGYDYCFTQTSPFYENMSNETDTFLYTFTDLAGTTYTNQKYFPSGTYSPIDNFSGLIGCPINGNWTLKITDNLSSDNGYIFSWGLTFDSTLFSEDSIVSTVSNSYWSGGNGSIVLSDSVFALVVPSDIGLYTFYYNTTTTDGCSFVDSLDVYVDNVVFVENIQNVSSLKVFPIPSNNEVTFIINLLKSSDIIIEISDISEKIVKTITLDNIVVGENRFTELLDFESGIYLLKIKTETELIVKKIIKI